MKRKKWLKLIFIIIVIIGMLRVNVSSAVEGENEEENDSLESSFVFTAKADKTEVEPGGEVVIIDMSVSDINLGEHGMNVVGGYLFYDTEFFSDMELVNVNDWEITYNTEEGERNGKFLIVKMVDGIHEEESICQIKVTVNKDLIEGEGTVELKEIQSNDGEKLVDEGDRTITIKIKQPNNSDEQLIPNVPDNSNPLTENEKSNKPSEETNLTVKNQSISNNVVNSKPNTTENVRTGDNIIYIFVIIILVFLINFIINMIRKKSNI